MERRPSSCPERASTSNSGVILLGGSMSGCGCCCCWGWELVGIGIGWAVVGVGGGGDRFMVYVC